MLQLEMAATNCWFPRANDPGRRTVPVKGSHPDTRTPLLRMSRPVCRMRSRKSNVLRFRLGLARDYRDHCRKGILMRDGSCIPRTVDAIWILL
jgi:hypothetical protein